MTQTIKKFRNLLTFAMLLAFMMVIPSITAKASTYDYTINGTTRSLSIINGETTLTADGKTYNLTRQLVAADAAIDQYGTTWILFKNGAVYWWSYDLEKDSTQVEIHKLFSSTGNQVYAEKFLFEGADEVTVTGYQTSSGSKFSLLTLEEIKLLLNITDSSTVTTEKSTSSGNTSSTVTTEKSTSSGNTSSTVTTEKSTSSGKTSSTVTTDKSTSSGNIKCTRVVHSKYRYRLYSGKKTIALAKLRKGKLTWRGYSCKKIKAIGFIKKSKNLIAITKDGKVFTLKYDDMSKKYILGSKAIKKYGKAICFNYDKHGFVTHIVTNKPKRIKVKNK